MRSIDAVVIVLSVGALCIPARVSHAQSDTIPPEAKSMVVRVLPQRPVTESMLGGSGIVVGYDARYVYVITARHVLTQLVNEDNKGYTERVDTQARVAFHGRTDTVLASRIGEAAGYDLVVLRVSRDTALRGWSPPSFDRLGHGLSLRFGDDVHPVGCPQGKCYQPAPADHVVGSDRNWINFQSLVADDGSSGGALFDKWWDLVGMITSREPPRDNALPIEVGIAALQGANVPIALRPPRIPRRGYQELYSLYLLLPMSAVHDSLATEWRAPSFRFVGAFRSQSWFGWHAALIRLAPDNLAVTAGLFGLDATWRPQRFLFQAFAEGGIGRSTSRYDQIGYFTSEGGTQKYHPLWAREQVDGLGAGGGFLGQFIVAPRWVVSATIGKWSFSVPEHSPRLPKYVVGFGLAFGR